MKIGFGVASLGFAGMAIFEAREDNTVLAVTAALASASFAYQVFKLWRLTRA